MMLFSNQYRFKKIVVLAFIILGLGLYSYKIGPKTELSYQNCLNEPERCRGQEIAVLYAPVIFQNEEGLVLKDCQGPVLVKGIKEEIGAKHISVKGVFQDNAIMMTQTRTHPQRYLKYLISLVAVILVAIAFFKEFTFNFQKKVFKNA